MKTNIDLTPVIELVITVLSTVITLCVIPRLKQKLSEERFNRLSCVVCMAVKAAEQIYGSKTGQQKKEYVISYLKSKNIAFDIDEVEAMIESEVFKLKAGLRESNP